MAGIAICLSGHPLDTLKVKMQMEGGTLRGTVAKVLKEDGISGYYRGILYPLITVPLVNAVVFGAY